MDRTHYCAAFAQHVIDPVTKKTHNISVRGGVPYITYKRKTRILFEGPFKTGAVITIGPEKKYFRDWAPAR